MKQPHPLIVELRRIRRGLELTQGDVADRTGLTRTAISMLECGDRWPTMRTLDMYAAAIGQQITVTPLPDLSEVPS